MLTQAQAQKHGEDCGLKGIAECLPISNCGSALRARYRLSADVVHPESMDVIAYKGDCLSGHTLNALSACYGMDYVFTM